MNSYAFISLIPIITLLLWLAPVIFIVWFLLKFLKVQQEKNNILKNISDKLDKMGKTGS